MHASESVKGPQVSNGIGLITVKELSSSPSSQRPSWEEVSVTALPIYIVKVAASATSPKHRGAANTKEGQGEVNVAATPLSPPERQELGGKNERLPDFPSRW